MTTPAGADAADRSNLTELEISALDAGINVADGHARQELTLSQQKIIDDLPSLFEQASRTSATALDRAAQVAFFSALGQHEALARATALTCYSSSVAMEILARTLRSQGTTRIALIHPTFDNIPDILLGFGMVLSPVSENQLLTGPGDGFGEADVLFVTTPNNPTGFVLPDRQLARWGSWCAARRMTLVLDTSFRGFDNRAQYDHYAVLAEAGCQYVIIEDTGKLWPTLDLKAGFLVFTKEQLALRRIYTDIMIGVSPLILALIRRFSEEASQGGLAELHQFIGQNRALLRAGLAEVTSLSFPDPESRTSVERIALGADQNASRLWSDLRGTGVHLLPCSQFHWDDPAAGERFIRVALARPARSVALAAAAIRQHLTGS
ncbi:MAG TPA: aminotransferase class I/II-fold pyridoxal phosphate-dependent enzyme [Streptosporangiaceae bacterium]|nr:aminotransferase class I/II-fold pyridoxal phosphate-dependent enzyme [Streptosporangiaceae bacterium]